MGGGEGGMGWDGEGGGPLLIEPVPRGNEGTAPPASKLCSPPLTGGQKGGEAPGSKRERRGGHASEKNHTHIDGKRKGGGG
jgi:hypothetical protein